LERKRVSFRFPSGLMEQVRMIADWKGISMTSYIILAITDKLNLDVKDYIDVGGKWKRN